MKIAIHQPNFMPYLGFFDKCDYAGILVIYDSTQFKKKDFQNRNKIRGKEKWFWLNVPIKFNSASKINEVKIDNSKDWRRVHLKALKTCYSNSPYFDKYFPVIKSIYSKNWEYLCSFNVELIEIILRELGISCKIILSSDLSIKSSATEGLVEICQKVGADHYISGKDGKNYMDIDYFKDKIKILEFQDYKHPEYHQGFGNNFEPYMCILDLLFNEGPQSLRIIKEGRKYTQ